MNIAHTHSIEECKNKYSRLGTPGKGKGSVGKGKGKDGKDQGKGSKGDKGMGKGKGKGKDKHQLGRCHMLLLPPEGTLQVSVPKMVGSPLIIVLSEAHPTPSSAIRPHS
jgi:hypothetical protein